MFDFIKYLPLVNELVSLLKELIHSNKEVKASNEKLCCLLDEKAIKDQTELNRIIQLPKEENIDLKLGENQ